MGSKEAIQILKTIRMDEFAEFIPIGTWYKGINADYAEAISMAIKALEKEPEDDVTE